MRGVSLLVIIPGIQAENVCVVSMYMTRSQTSYYQKEGGKRWRLDCSVSSRFPIKRIKVFPNLVESIV